MFTLRGSSWGPVALPDFLRAQLAAHGFSPGDAGRCARLINDHHGGAAAASLFVDLGSCKFLEADIDGAIAAWRHAIASQHDAAAARSMLNLGLLYEHLHLHEQAIGLLARVAERNVDPYVMPAAMASARSQVALGNADQAMETMARLAQSAMVQRPDGPELIEALHGLGEVAEHAGRPDRAERAWRVAAASPASLIQQEAAARLIQLLVRQGHSHAVAANATGSGIVLLDNAELLLRTGEKEAAAQLLSTVDAADFATVDRFRFVDANLMAGRVNESIDELEALLAADDGQVQHRALFSLGRVYASYDMIDPAISMFQRTVASDDPYWMPAASLALGDLLAARGDRAPANEYWSYAAAGAVPRIAEQARARIAQPDAAADPDALEQEVVVLSELAPSELTRSEAAPSESAPSESARSESMPVAPADNAAAQPELAEPHVISLDSIDETTLVSANGARSMADIAADEISLDVRGPAEAEPEAVLVVLADVEDASTETDMSAGVVVDLNELADGDLAAEADDPATASAFASYVDGDDAVANPYAALAPDGHASDVAPTTRNPYAELAPNFADGDFEPPADVEPGDWESILGDWPRDGQPPKPKKRPSAFSRYT